MKKAQYYKISLKDGKLITELQIKDDINNFNDKRYMTDNLIQYSSESISHVQNYAHSIAFSDRIMQR